MSDVEEAKELLLVIENRGNDTIKKPVSPSDVPILLFEHVTDGCGGAGFRPWMHEFLKTVCRKHDWRYQQGYKEWHRVRADFLLFFEGIGYCFYKFVESLILIDFFKALKAIPAFMMLLPYLIILLFSGWYTFSRFKSNGEKMTGFQSLESMELRADIRKEEQNPKASYNERNKVSKANEQMIAETLKKFRDKT